LTFTTDAQLLHNGWPVCTPTIQRFGAVIVRTYADDHAPPHFHIEALDFEILLRISDLAIIAGEARPSQIAEVLRWAERERPALALRWAELNERG
jgi:hypothetical protein